MIDIIVVNWRTPELIDQFIEGCRDITIPYTLTVVDVDAIRPYRMTVAGQIIRTSTNVGYSGACNKAVLSTSQPYIGLFNSDTVIWPGVVERCVELLANNEDYGVVGPLQVDQDNRVTHGGIFGTNSKPKHRGWRARVTPALQGVEEAVTVSGSAYFTKRALWDLLTACPAYQAATETPPVGAFLPTPHYYEETWYSYHARAHGYKVMYCGDVRMFHSWHKSSPVGSVEKMHYATSQAMFRRACDIHGIERD